jgi:hypothetical protein
LGGSTSTGGTTTTRSTWVSTSWQIDLSSLETIIPFFERHPLRSSKREDFEKFVRCVELVAGDSHRTPAGLIEIAEIAQTMNRRKPRHDLIRILRGHTPDIQATG